MEKTMEYVTLSPKMMVQLAAPHTWVAAVAPVLVGVSIALSVQGSVSHELWIIMLVTCILMQSGVNILNDYMDFKKGADTLENQLDETDAVMVYNRVNPKHVLFYFFAVMVVALILGIYLVYRTSLVTLALGVFGAAIIVIYSAGKTPLSYLPLGELASGFTMGGIICLATAYVLTGQLDGMYLLLSLPLVFGIGLINMTNNTCDIEKDIEAKRNTLPVILGRKKALAWYHAFVIVIMASVVILPFVFHGFEGHSGMYPVLVMFPLLSFSVVKNLMTNPLILNTRGPAMGQVIMFNICCSVFYAMALMC